MNNHSHFSFLHSPFIHEVRAVPTKTGFLYYFDASGHAYIWWQGGLRVATPKSCQHKQQLKHNKGGGYLQLRGGVTAANRTDKRGTMYIHRGVAFAFPEICGTPDLFRNQIDHINGDRFDNRASNLRWVTASENMKAAYAIAMRKLNNKELCPQKPQKVAEILTVAAQQIR